MSAIDSQSSQPKQSADALAALHILQDAVKKGAKIIYGPQEAPPIGPKDPFFYPTTVLTGITSEMQLSHEEVRRRPEA